MNTPQDIRKKLVLLLSNVIGSCILKARMVPYILKQEEIVNLIIEDPAYFEKLIQEEQSICNENSKDDITASFDALVELQKIKTIDSYAGNYRHFSETEIQALLDFVNQMTRTFGVFVSNAFTLLDKRMAEFISNYREFLAEQQMVLRKIDFTADETGMLEESAVAYIHNGEFLQAFTFARLLNEQSTIKEIIRFPSSQAPLYENLIKHSLKDPVLAADLVDFILHASYLSHGNWSDLFQILSRIILKQPEESDRLKYIEAIERNIVFCCNLLHKSVTDIRDMPSTRIRIAILHSLDEFRN